ncbi:hypothetical protein BA768_04180 [Chryseobacterium sp. CBo1]|uniref:HmuY family protein n=1 Tax=Chryseobacterium sp. CBo1 TaxID=1869230 RepID=UPI000810959A|nr:HmuY family protein [Chryseobacterium sp. CBo1]OCK50990.1 hypothetical protein BA768_04180 [Chryseobacterium sp. CBo1]
MKKLLFCLLAGASIISQSCINDNEDPIAVPPIEGQTVEPSVGGGAQPNQVWIDLSETDSQGNPKQTFNRRTDWDLAFYTGNEFKVVLNSSIAMGAGKGPNLSDLAQVNEINAKPFTDLIQVANFDAGNEIYIDDVKGNFPTATTAIGEVKANDAENGIYLINMGKDIYGGTVPSGSALTGGDFRGWVKLQIVRNGDGYKIKYAELNSNVIKEAVITKNNAYNFKFFSLKNNTEVSVQPEKKKWDISFTVFTNIFEGAGSYVYADFVTHNIMGGAGAYEVKVTAPMTSTEAFNNFKASDIDNSKFVYNDQRVIGGNWRTASPSGSAINNSVFYVIKDPNGYYFKLKFMRLSSPDGERGRPQFEFKPL